MSLPNEITLRGRPLLLMEPHAVDAKPLARTLRGQVAESITGARIVETNPELPGGVHQLDFVCETRADTRFVEDFFDARLGAAEGFWVPTWQWEFEIAPYTESDPFTLWVWIRPASYGVGPFALGAPFRYLALLYADAINVYAVSAVTPDHPAGSGYERLTLTREIEGTFETLVSRPWTEEKGVRPLWLRYVRFADDEIETQELNLDASIVTVRVMELPRETP